MNGSRSIQDLLFALKSVSFLLIRSIFLSAVYSDIGCSGMFCLIIMQKVDKEFNMTRCFSLEAYPELEIMDIYPIRSNWLRQEFVLERANSPCKQ